MPESNTWSEASEHSQLRWVGAPSLRAPKQTVYYGLSGEGQGHAMRAIPIIEYLRKRVDVVVLTSGRALEVLRQRYRRDELELRTVPGLTFQYNASGRLSPSKTAVSGVGQLREIRQASQRLAHELRYKAAAVVSDFEPVTLSAANRAEVPSLSIDHQRMLQVCDFDQFPLPVRVKAAALQPVVHIVYGVPRYLVVSGFHLPPNRPQYKHARLTGVLIREELLTLVPSIQPYLLAYVRRGCPTTVLEALACSPMPVHLYGLGAQPSRGVLHFHAACQQSFAQRLAACSAVVCTAGNQLIGEAFFFRKPVLAFPEPGNLEQHINAELLQASGGGAALSHRRFNQDTLPKFCRSLATYRANLRYVRGHGNQEVFQAVDVLLEEMDRPPPRGSVVSESPIDVRAFPRFARPSMLGVPV